jgi:hypothetical protein
LDVREILGVLLSFEKNFRSRFPLKLIRGGTFTHQGEVSGPVLVGFRLNRFHRKTEFTRAGLLTTDQKVSGSNPLGRAFRVSALITENTVGSARISFRRCRSRASDHQRFGTVARR